MQKDGFERLFIGEKEREGGFVFADVKVPMGLSAFRDRMLSLFPEEASSLKAFFDDVIAIYEAYCSALRKVAVSESRLLQATKLLMSGRIPLATKVKFASTAMMPLKTFFDHYALSPLLRRVLYGHGGIFAESETEMSAIAYIAATGNYHSGAWYPEKGFHHFFSSLARVVEENRGRVELGKRVVGIVEEEDWASGVQCYDGSRFSCDLLFSDISPRLTARLLGRDTSGLDYAPSHSIPSCCLAFESGVSGISEMRGRNYWWQDGREVNYRNPDMLSPPRMLFLASPTANGFGAMPSVDKHAMLAFCPGNYIQERMLHSRGAESAALFRRRLAKEIVSILDRNIFPGIADKLVFAKVLSSIDIERATLGEGGNAYGRRLSVDEIMKGPINDADIPANLYNVSASKNCAGIASGIFTAMGLYEVLTGETI